MKNLLRKELKLATLPLTWIFLLFTFMTFLPGYPILMGPFFVCLGLFQSFQMAREANDTLYTVLLPVKKTDAVRAKYTVVCFFQVISQVLMAIFTVIRMTLMGNHLVYVKNALMNATPYFLAFALLIYLLFNVVFLGGFFKTAYKIGKPYITFLIVSLFVIGIGEALIHIPGLTFLRSPAGEKLSVQFGLMAAAAVLYVIFTKISEKNSMLRFEQIDL